MTDRYDIGANLLRDLAAIANGDYRPLQDTLARQRRSAENAPLRSTSVPGTNAEPPLRRPTPPPHNAASAD